MARLSKIAQGNQTLLRSVYVQEVAIIIVIGDYLQYDYVNHPRHVNHIGNNLTIAQTYRKGDHSQLIKEVVKHKTFFTENEFWALPYDDNWSLPLRMDSRVILYRAVHHFVHYVLLTPS